jgi:2'-hydroxyisoflavone reductase
LRILVLGGTQFVGRAFVEEALAAGYELTLFHRGRTNPELFPEAEHLLGDRDGGLAPLAGRSWDSCVDTCGYVPRVVGQSAELLHDAVDRYVFVSTIAVYARFDQQPVEGAPLAGIEDPATEAVTGGSYGGLKALCEEVVEHLYGDRATLIRPGFVAGEHDPTGRLTYWAHRGERGGDALAPASLAAKFQAVDARDLGTFLVRAIEDRLSGPFNVTAPMPPGSVADVLHAAEAAAGSDLSVTVVDDDFLVEQEVGTQELPLWLPPAEYPRLMDADVSRALAAGFAPRPLAETAAAALAAPLVEGVGLTPEREADLLAAWSERRASVADSP